MAELCGQRDRCFKEGTIVLSPVAAGHLRQALERMERLLRSVDAEDVLWSLVLLVQHLRAVQRLI